MEGPRTDGRERRRHQRYVVDLPTHVVIDGRTIGCRLIDVSRSGALVSGPASVTVGDRVMLQIPGRGDVVATVVRTTPINFALAFAGTIVLAAAGGCDDDDEDNPAIGLQDCNPRLLM